jgi:hypothetical protein
MLRGHPAWPIGETVTTDARTLDRVRKLLAKAEGTDNGHERETFLAAATDLMAKYGIEQAMLGDARPRADPESRTVHAPAPWADEKARLIYYIAEAMRCKAVLMGKRNGEQGVRIFGFPPDLERAEVLYTSLLLQMISGLARAAPDPASPRAWRRSWLLGFIGEVTHRVQAAERHAEDRFRSATGESTALVLADRESLVRRAFEREYPKVRRSSTRTSGGGYGAGVAAGRRANLGGTGLGGGSPSSLEG